MAYKAINKSTGKEYRYDIEADGHYFVFAPRKRRLGWRYTADEFNELYTPKEAPDETACWHRRIRTAVKKLNNSGLWPELSEFLKTLLEIDWYDLQAMRDEYWNSLKMHDKGYISKWSDKYPFVFDKKTDSEMVCMKFEYIAEKADCILKSMYFGEYNSLTKQEIRNAISAKQSYSSGRIEVTYDVSFEYNAERNKAWYSEEYRGCLNGYYYIALDHNTAMFIEKD